MKKTLLTLGLGFVAAAVFGAQSHYHFIKEIPIGGEEGWDYLAVDSAAQRLYVSHGSKVVVVDLAADKVTGEISNTPGVHGIAIAPDLGRGFISDGGEARASVFDLKTLRTLFTVATGPNPDAILYEPQQQEVYTFNGRGDSATVIGAKSGKVVTTIPLGGKPEFAVADPQSGRVYDNLEDKSQVAVIDARTHQVLQRWPIAPGESASGMAIDLQRHRLLVGCHNQRMVMMDGATGKVLASVPIGRGVDADAFDPGTQLAFASCGDGTTTIAREQGDALTVVQTLKTEPGARTMALDPKTHRIYLSTARLEGAPQGRRRGRMVPGSFKVLVYGMD